MRLLSVLTASISSSLLSTLLFAADVPGSHDLEIVPRVLDSEIVDYRPPMDQQRIYPLGSVRKVSGQLRFEGQVAAKGLATAVTYELPAGHTSDEAFTAAREGLQKQGAELLYWCQARDCGESSLWANEVFGNSKLFGADDQQAYLLLRLAAPKDDTLVALYGITRGNRRAYLHVEQFDSDAPLGELLPTSATLLRQLKSTGKLEFPKLKGEPQDPWTILISRALNLDSTLRVTVSGAHGEVWRQALIANSVRAARLETGSADKQGLVVELIR
ncbi:DUF4892 domain-containing protein [Pseudomonas sp. 10B1]|uniref:DUF4892 domain-containing protein n=1 Tax=unclassified Pseudomonas TaxID=196821 RepID=UPI002AB4DBD0|nr:MULTISPECIES: DUF4892 domain-containing protein [unclassified Pseudomonas]MDY7560579.1 DUF4892 domain-containing protein [Pseudomonas sp. AB6]MEA9975827.1 DUF4892 domain-containing protein [Pseudomonas sp. RTS4]MEA9993335.1 DUF4892 domain-containing protein [Pseudomonas sp. AA4]MEB0088475.1 DUF4892 domain-containing protein [Pseudomonas sp. RTI1]MEB0124178.1 DUF4892 domain-containing protein [Pseudomonas sp. CCC1.2]